MINNKDDLIPGNIYYHEYDNNKHIERFDCLSNGSLFFDYSLNFNNKTFEIFYLDREDILNEFPPNIREATDEEIKHFNLCLKANKYVEMEIEYENLLDLEPGDIVRCIPENKSKFCKQGAGAGWKANDEFEIGSVSKDKGFNVYWRPDGEHGVYSDAVILVKKKESEEIKSTKEEELIAEATRKYPIGTKFYPAHINQDDSYCIITNHNFHFDDGELFVLTSNGKNYESSKPYKEGNCNYNRLLYYKGKWAEIVEEESLEKKSLKKEDFYNTRIWIGNNPELSKLVQEKAFELGFSWENKSKEILYTYTSSLCFWSDNSIGYGDYDNIKTFEKNLGDFKEITIDDLGINYKDMKKENYKWMKDNNPIIQEVLEIKEKFDKKKEDNIVFKRKHDISL